MPRLEGASILAGDRADISCICDEGVTLPVWKRTVGFQASSRVIGQLEASRLESAGNHNYGNVRHAREVPRGEQAEQTTT